MKMTSRLIQTLALTLLSGSLALAQGPLITEYLGTDAGQAVTSADFNVFIGDFTGYTTTSGSNNTFLGYRAGFGEVELDESLSEEVGDQFFNSANWSILENNTNSDNTAIGAFAGYNIDGVDNTFIGARAGFNNQDSDGTFVGADAGRENTNGNDNTFIGEQAGFSNTTGDNNTYVGEDAGGDIDTGYRNTGVGANAFGFSSTSPKTGNAIYANTVIGNEAGSDLTGQYLSPDSGVTTTFNNTFLGAHAGGDNGWGRANTYVGAQAGVNSEFGDYNTFVGTGSGWDNNRTNNNNVAEANRNTYVGIASGANNREGSDNVILGAFADVRTWDGVSEAQLIDVFDGSSWSSFNIEGSGTTDGGTSPETSRTVTIGGYARSGRNDSVTIGYSADSLQQRAIVIGTQSQGNHVDSIVIGYNAQSHGNDIAVIGNDDTISIDPHSDGSTALGSTSFRFASSNAKTYNTIADEALPASIQLSADLATDNDDNWRVSVADGGDFTIESFANGLYTPLLTLTNAGDLTVPGEISLNSDVRLKKDIQELTSALSTINQLKPKSYEWKEFLEKAPGRHYGLIAQDVETVIPEVVSNDAEGIKSIAYQELIPILVGAVNELSEQNREQQKVIDELQELRSLKTSYESELTELKVLIQDQKDMMKRIQADMD